jgi:hypothetical protein
MSHFTVAVIGENVEEQLRPFHEFECTGSNDQYIQDVDITEELHQDYAKYNNEEGRSFLDFVVAWTDYQIVPSGEEPDKQDTHKYGYIVLEETEHGQIVNVFRRTNPNAKWDWYQIGGRWSGELLLKNGRRVDSALKKDIDFEGMLKEKVRERMEIFDYIAKRVQFTPSFFEWKSWDKEKQTVEEFRALYEAQPEIVQWESIRKVSDCPARIRSVTAFGNPSDYNCSRQEYLQEIIDEGAFVTFAFLKDGKWAERGKMGWWACVSDEKDNWEEQFQELLNQVGDEELITVVDCHI